MFERLPLKDIHLPDPVSWWPPAAGWWLAALVLVLFAVLIRVLHKSISRALDRRRLRKQVLRELESIERALHTGTDTARILGDLSTLLRRVAITVYPERAVAGRVGRSWTEWLCDTGPGDLDTGALENLTHAPYRKVPGSETPRVLTAVGQWIRHAVGRYRPVRHRS